MYPPNTKKRKEDIKPSFSFYYLVVARELQSEVNNTQP
jgi:hypothetical protein